MENIHFIGNSLFSYTNKKIINSSLNALCSYLDNVSIISIDIETTRRYKKGRYKEDKYKAGLDPYLSNILMLQIGDDEKQFIIDIRAVNKDTLSSILKPYLESEEILKIGHNLKFETKFLYHHLGIELHNVWDTMICERILYNGYLHSYSLEALMYRYFNIKPVNEVNLFTQLNINEEDEVEMYIDKSTRLQFIEWGDKPFTEKQIIYGADDIIYPYKIYQIQKKGRKVNGKLWNPKKAFYIENNFILPLSFIELNGMPFNKVKWLELYKINFKKLQERKVILDNYIINNIPKFASSVNLFSNVPECNIQWSSSTQVIKLFKHLDICPKEKSKTTGKMSFTVGAIAMEKLLDFEYKQLYFRESFPNEITNVQELILAYLLYKKTEQLTTTFGKDFLQYVHPITGRVHSNYNQFKNTGRLSSSNPNLQNIPSKKEFRDCFTDGSLIVNCDFSGQETRLSAQVSKVPRMMDFFINSDPTFGTDYHSFVATYMYREIYDDSDLVISKKTHPEERNAIKPINFAIDYGASAHSLMHVLGKTLEETEEILDVYYNTLEGKREFQEREKEKALERGWVTVCIYSDKRYFYPHYHKIEELTKEVYSLTEYEQFQRIPEQEKERLRKETKWSELWREINFYRGKLERKGLNYQIQGSGATQIKIACILFYKKRKDKSQHLISQIHDELLAISKLELIDNTKILLEESMVRGGELVTPDIPMIAEAVVSTHWEH